MENRDRDASNMALESLAVFKSVYSCKELQTVTAILAQVSQPCTMHVFPQS